MHVQLLKQPLINKLKIQHVFKKKAIYLAQGPRQLLPKMKKEKGNTTDISAAERHFYLLWESKCLQSNDCSKQHDILISFNTKRNDREGKHSKKPYKMYCLTTENNAIKKEVKKSVLHLQPNIISLNVQ